MFILFLYTFVFICMLWQKLEKSQGLHYIIWFLHEWNIHLYTYFTNSSENDI